MSLTDERPRSDETPPSRQAPTRLGRVLPVASVVAAVLALVFGALWLIALNSDAVTVASDRDAVLTDARQAVLNLNTLDYHDAQAGLDLWIQSSTGSVRDEFVKNRDAYAQLVTQQKRTTTATVSDAAVGELDSRSGVARVLLGVDVTVTPEGQQPTVTRQRIEAEMTRTDDGWKVSALDPLLTPGNGNG
jgi:Mce-associated membrane protein